MRTFVLAALAALCIALPARAQLALDPTTAGGKSGTLTTVTTDTVTIPALGIQWATIQFKVTTAGTATATSQVSIDGGVNWIASAYAKRLSTVSANPTVQAISATTLVTGDVWEVPLPGNATHFRLLCGGTGTTTTVNLMGGAVYVPGVPVVATLYDVTSAVNTNSDTGVLDMSGWKTAFLAYSSGGATAGNVTMGQPADDGTNIGGSFNVVSAAVASKQQFTRENNTPNSNVGITRRNQWVAASVVAQQTRLRIEAYR